jgi:hypothetical protein
VTYRYPFAGVATARDSSEVFAHAREVELRRELQQALGVDSILQAPRLSCSTCRCSSFRCRRGRVRQSRRRLRFGAVRTSVHQHLLDATAKLSRQPRAKVLAWSFVRDATVDASGPSGSVVQLPSAMRNCGSATSPSRRLDVRIVASNCRNDFGCSQRTARVGAGDHDRVGKAATTESLAR